MARKMVKLEIWSDYTLEKVLFCGEFKSRESARAFVSLNYPNIDCDCIAVDDQILMGNDEW